MTWYLKLAELAYSATQPRWRRWLYIVPAVLAGLYVTYRFYEVNKERDRLTQDVWKAREEVKMLKLRARAAGDVSLANALLVDASNKAELAAAQTEKLGELTAKALDLRAEIDLANDLRGIKDTYDKL